MTQAKNLNSDLCKGHWPHLEAMSSRKSFFANNFRLKRDTDMGLVSLHFSRRDASDDMQHDLFEWPHDLDLKSNFDLDLSRSKNISFNASRREKHDGTIADSLSFFVQTLFTKNGLRKKRLFWKLLTYRGLTVDLRSIFMKTFSKEEFKGYH